MVLLVLLTGCGKNAETQAPAADCEEMTFPLIVSNDIPENLPEMQERLNAYIGEKLGLSIQFVPVDVDTLENFYLLQKPSLNTTDFICLMPAVTQLPAIVDSGLVLPLDDLLEQYGHGLSQAIDGIADIGRLRDVQYMIPAVKDVYTMGTSIEFNAALVKKYDFDITAVHTITDLEPMLAVIAGREPDVIPLTTYTMTGFTQPLGGYDNLGDSLGVLDLCADPSMTVVDWYETEGFLAHVQQMRN